MYKVQVFFKVTVLPTKELRLRRQGVKRRVNQTKSSVLSKIAISSALKQSPTFSK